MSTLKTNITNHPILSLPREAEMFRLIFNKNWEMFIEIDIYLKNQQGQRLFDLASELPNKQQRDAAQKDTFPLRVDYTTLGSTVDALGNVVEEGGVISERDAMFSITNDQLLAMTGKSGNDSALETIREFVRMKMQEISNRGQN